MTETPEGTSPDLAAALTAEYAQKRPLYRDYAKKCKDLIEELLRREQIRVHSVESREKDPQTLAEKLNRADRQYRALTDVTDLAGIRIITYLLDEIDLVAGVIEREFHILPEHSVNKSQLLDPDRFGYLSLHYVCRLPDRRTSLPEYGAFADLACEIQIRSILQHAWAEIEHDLGYKTAESIPRHIRRRFSRLAALLESADEEFTRIRDNLRDYAEAVSQTIQERPEAVLLDKVSLAAYVAQSATLTRLDREMAERIDATIREMDPESSEFQDMLEYHVRLLRAAGVTTVGQLEAAAAEHERLIVEQFARRFGDRKGRGFISGISVLNLAAVLLILQGRVDVLAASYEERNSDADEAAARAQELSRVVEEIYNEMNRP